MPVSKLPELVYETKKDLAQHGIVSTIVGHVGDGNFHALLLFRNEEELAIARAAVHRMVKRAIALDGTCKWANIVPRLLTTSSMTGTGEHGVGIGKKEYLIEELGAGTVELMKTVKRAIDPLGLFNPGKVIWVVNLRVNKLLKFLCYSCILIPPRSRTGSTNETEDIDQPLYK